LPLSDSHRAFTQSYGLYWGGRGLHPLKSAPPRQIGHHGAARRVSFEGMCGVAHSHPTPDNRRSQAEFVCLRCGHADHADPNASSGDQKPRDSETPVRRIAHQAAQTHGDFSAARAETIRRDDMPSPFHPLGSGVRRLPLEEGVNEPGTRSQALALVIPPPRPRRGGPAPSPPDDLRYNRHTWTRPVEGRSAAGQDVPRNGGAPEPAGAQAGGLVSPKGVRPCIS
jgi:hypothetical protein